MSKKSRDRKQTLRKAQRDSLEMGDGCLDMIRDCLIGHGIPMDACPPMMYPEAIHNTFVGGARAARVCQRDHNWHNENEAEVGKCIGEQIKAYWAAKRKPSDPGAKHA